MSQKVTFSIEGMHCGSCAAGIQMLLESTDGVVKASASYKQKEGEVEFDEKKVTFKKLAKVVEELEYKVAAIKG